MKHAKYKYLDMIVINFRLCSSKVECREVERLGGVKR